MPRIKKLRVDFISLVDQPANRKAIILKAEEGDAFSFKSDLRIVRKDAQKGIVYATVYEPDEMDTQGDWAEPPEIEDAAHDFLKRKRVEMVDLQHNYEPGYGTIVESFIKHGSDDRFPETKDGSWCVAIKLSDTGKEHLNEIGGVSMAGGGQYDEAAAPPSLNAKSSVTKQVARARIGKRAPLARIRTNRK